MINIAFQYDFSRAAWVRCEKEAYIQEGIETLPCLLIFEDRTENDQTVLGHRVLCSKHNKIEKVAKYYKDYVVSTDGCVIEGLMAPCDYDLGRETYHEFEWGGETYREDSFYPSFFLYGYEEVLTPFRWRIIQQDAADEINIVCDMAVMNHWLYLEYGKILKWYQFVFSADIRQRKLQITALGAKRPFIRKSWETDAGIVIPAIALDIAMEMLQESAKQILGIESRVKSQMQGGQKLAAFVERPFDLHIVFLKSFLWRFFIRNSFDYVFPYEMKDPYSKICQLLKVQPPEIVRNTYSYNPYAIIWYMIFRQWGVENTERIQPFLYLNDNIGGEDLRDLFYNPDKEYVSCKYASNIPLTLNYFGLQSIGTEEEILQQLYQRSLSDKFKIMNG